MTADAWITLAVTAAMVVALATSFASPDLVVLAALAALLLLGVLDAEAALAGFASPALGAVAALLVVAAGVQATGGLDAIARRLLGRPRSVPGAQLRLMLPVAAASAFLNNTPIVAMMVPAVLDWCRRSNLPTSRFLIPLSYATILGGVCTLVGTSTNLVVFGMAKSHPSGVDIGLFDVAVLGLPALLVGVAYVLAASRWLLPDRRPPGVTRDNAREYTVAVTVAPGPEVAGRTVEEAGLRHLPGLFLVEVERGPDAIPAPPPTLRLLEGDVLRFAGIVESVRDLRKHPGLAPATDQVEKLASPTQRRRLYEAVVAANAPMVGRSVRDFGFRTRYGAAIIAVHRRGERVAAKVGDIVLRAGDALLLEGGPDFYRDRRHDPDFALVAEVERSAPPLHDRAFLALAVLAGMVVVNATGLVSIFAAALGAAGLLVATRCLTGAEARRSLDLQVLLTIGAAFGVGRAMADTGLARVLAEGLVSVGAPLGPTGVIAAIYLATAMLTELITNNGAAAIMFPIAAAAAERAGLDLHACALVLMVAASASFATPIGYQTNLMVLGPGGYRFSDFLRFGLPLQLLVGATVITVASVWLV